jgi:hypothetical protein
MWETDYLVAKGALRPDLGRRLKALLGAEDQNQAWDIVYGIECLVAPDTGGLSDDATGVVTALVAGLPRMSAVARGEALQLLFRIVGSLGDDGVRETPSAQAAARRLEGVLPVLAAMIETGSDVEVGEGIDCLSMYAYLSQAAAERVEFYLSQLATTSIGTLKDHAEMELAEVRKVLSGEVDHDGAPSADGSPDGGPAGSQYILPADAMTDGPHPGYPSVSWQPLAPTPTNSGSRLARRLRRTIQPNSPH